MYSVSRQKDSKFGSVILINREENGIYLSPIFAFNQAKYMRRLWLEEGEIKVRLLIDNQLMTVVQAERWSNEEYKSLPKCGACVKILSEQVYTHQLSGSSFFCSQHCSDQSFRQESEKINDEEEIDYL